MSTIDIFDYLNQFSGDEDIAKALKLGLFNNRPCPKCRSDRVFSQRNKKKPDGVAWKSLDCYTGHCGVQTTACLVPAEEAQKNR
jgi:hypothetical protein